MGSGGNGVDDFFVVDDFDLDADLDFAVVVVVVVVLFEELDGAGWLSVFREGDDDDKTITCRFIRFLEDVEAMGVVFVEDVFVAGEGEGEGDISLRRRLLRVVMMVVNCWLLLSLIRDGDGGYGNGEMGNAIMRFSGCGVLCSWDSLNCAPVTIGYPVYRCIYNLYL